jgi:hypothetical protein
MEGATGVCSLTHGTKDYYCLIDSGDVILPRCLNDKIV